MQACFLTFWIFLSAFLQESSMYWHPAIVSVDIFRLSGNNTRIWAHFFNLFEILEKISSKQNCTGVMDTKMIQIFKIRYFYFKYFFKILNQVVD